MKYDTLVKITLPNYEKAYIYYGNNEVDHYFENSRNLLLKPIPGGYMYTIYCIKGENEKYYRLKSVKVE